MTDKKALEDQAEALQRELDKLKEQIAKPEPEPEVWKRGDCFTVANRTWSKRMIVKLRDVYHSMDAEGHVYRNSPCSSAAGVVAQYKGTKRITLQQWAERPRQG